MFSRPSPVCSPASPAPPFNAQLCALTMCRPWLRLRCIACTGQRLQPTAWSPQPTWAHASALPVSIDPPSRTCQPTCQQVKDCAHHVPPLAAPSLYSRRMAATATHRLPSPADPVTTATRQPGFAKKVASFEISSSRPNNCGGMSAQQRDKETDRLLLCKLGFHMTMQGST
eukprot:362101-Chlamydomonas_euryale.AAC.6